MIRHMEGRETSVRLSAVSLAANGRPQQIARGLLAPCPVTSEAINQIIQARNQEWKGNPLIPSWVSLRKVELDRFFTRPAVAQELWVALLEVMETDHADAARYKFVEPAAGDGVFYDLLPADRRIGVEIVPGRPEFETTDFLSWRPATNGHRFAVVGNPPFGYRAWLALAFVNHAATFADYIGFILPMAFQSDGKGSPKHRVAGAELVDMRSLPPDAFVTASGQPAGINALWQVWRRGVNNRKPEPTCDDWIDLFTVDMRKERLCGQERLAQADWFLQRTFFNQPPALVRDFSQVRYVCGYGIVIKKETETVTACLNAVDWRHYSNLAAHNCRHISMYHIRRALTDNGFVDGRCSGDPCGDSGQLQRSPEVDRRPVREYPARPQHQSWRCGARLCREIVQRNRVQGYVPGKRQGET